MMSELHLSRVRLRSDAPVAALASSLLSAENGERSLKAHRLLWSLFADHPERTRDFLWRDEGGASWRRRTFLTLSTRPPEDRVRLFELETKPFAPQLSAGQRLRFRLRASPSINERRPSAGRGKRKDPVAHALRSLTREERASRRFEVLQQVGRDWLARQGERCGFRFPEGLPLIVDGEDWRAVPRNGSPPATFSVLDFEGVLEISAPAQFLHHLSAGIGRAKAFGCGLMLIRPA
jgi:CRISPR system Cascade subunit CasE